MKRSFFSIAVITLGILGVAFTATFSTAYHDKISGYAGTEDTNGLQQVKMVEYCLTGAEKTNEDSALVEASQVANAFPLYGSREEKAFRPGATIFSYNGNIDFKLKKAFKPRKKERSRECILIQESETQ